MTHKERNDLFGVLDLLADAEKTARITIINEFKSLVNKATKAPTCWVIERHDMPGRFPDGVKEFPAKYLTWPNGYVPDMEVDLANWDGHWERALKFFDRASCEMICAEMPDHWDIRIMEHQVG